MTNYTLEKITNHKQKFQTDKMKVPVVFHVADDLLPEDGTFEQLESVASNDVLFKQIAAMADVHSKPGRKNATGTSVASEKSILPQINDSDPVCGMRLMRTNLHEDNFSEADIAKLFETLTDRVPTKKLMGTRIPYDLVVDICRGGTQPLIDHLGIKTKNEIENSKSAGNYFGKEMSRQDIFNVIPKLFLHFAQFRLGILGAAGNHFLDLMKVTDVLDPAVAKKFNLRPGQYIFLIHAGSGILGQYTMYMYTLKRKEHLSQKLMVELGKRTFQSEWKDEYKKMAARMTAHDVDGPLFTYDAEALEGKMYMQARAAASNFGVANRATIAHNVGRTIEELFGKDPELDLLYDMAHIDISQEEHFGKNVWVHRNGTSRAFGPTRMASHPLFSQTGEPAFVPSSMSTPAFLGVGTDQNESSFFSSSHGTGLSKTKSESDIPQNRDELLQKMQRKGVKLYNGTSKITIKQDSSHYKDVTKVVEGIEDNNILNMVVKMQPVAVIMY